MWLDVEQNTDEWFDLRLKKATSSKFAVIMAHEGKPFGEPALRYAEQVALEIVTGYKEDGESYKSKDMENGHIWEPVAIEAYETETFLAVTKGGFNISSCERFGDSPDGNVGENGCVEVKSVIRTTQMKRLKKGGIDSSYKWQICGHIWLGNKQWCDFISFCPTMPENKKLFIYRVQRDEDMIKRLETRLNLWWEEVKKNIEILKN